MTGSALDFGTRNGAGATIREVDAGVLSRDGFWHHALVTHDSSDNNITLYFDGVGVDSVISDNSFN